MSYLSDITWKLCYIKLKLSSGKKYGFYVLEKTCYHGRLVLENSFRDLRNGLRLKVDSRDCGEIFSSAGQP